MKKWVRTVLVIALIGILVLPAAPAKAARHYDPCPYCGIAGAWLDVIPTDNYTHICIYDLALHNLSLPHPQWGYLYNHEKSIFISETLAACTADGIKIWHCNVCDYDFSEIIPALGHSFTNYVSDGNAACILDGTKTAVCDRCTETDTIVDTDSALGHSFTSYIPDGNADCTHDGTKTAVCDRCTETDTIADTGSALGHSFTNYIPDGNAACTADGTMTAVCDRCTETDTIADNGSVLGHSFTNYISDGNATCTLDGTKTAVCDRCTETDTIADTGSALGYSFTNYVSDGNATCTLDGTKTAVCDRCTETDTIADTGSAPGHSFTSYIPDGNADCTHDGTKTATCDRCTETDTIADTGSALGHSFTSYIPDGNADCTHDGTQTAICDRCTEIDTIADIGTALGHNYNQVIVAPSCTEEGCTVYTCSRCGDTYTGDMTRRLGHFYGVWSSAGGSKHSAVCFRAGCGYDHTTGCTPVERTVNGIAVSVCPVCGDTGPGEGLAWMAEAAAKVVTSELPGGEAVVRRGVLADGTEILSAAFEFAGKSVQPAGIVSFSLPSEGLEHCWFMLIHADGRETEIPCVIESGRLSFDLDFTPEGGEAIPAVLIRLVPIA